MKKLYKELNSITYKLDGVASTLNSISKTMDVEDENMPAIELMASIVKDLSLKISDEIEDLQDVNLELVK